MKTTKVLKRILRYGKPYLFYLILALLFASANVALTLYSPILIGDAVDCIVGAGRVDFPAIGTILVKLAAVIAGAALFSWLTTLCTNVVSYRTVRDMRSEVFQKFTDAPLRYIDQNSRGDLLSRMANDTEQIGNGLLQGFSQLFTGVITIIGTLAFMLSIQIPVALAVAVITPLSLFVAAFIAKRSHIYFAQQTRDRGEMTGYTEEMIGAQREIKGYCAEQRTQEKFEEINARLYQSGFRSQLYSALTNPSTRFVNGLVYTAVGVFGAFHVLSGRMSVGNLSSFLTYANQYTKPFNEISGVVTEFQSALASARRVFAVLDERSEDPDPSDAVELTDCRGEVRLENVCFSYDKEKKLIEDLCLSVRPGQKIAVVGPTGCGKTTLINLLMRFYDTDAGAIYVDGVNAMHYTKDSLRGAYGMVLQDTWLTSGTVRENIAFGNPDATDEEIIAAAKAAHIHGFIKRLPHGYDTRLGDDGGSISAGQKQLLCIARVMLAKPSMLILDEATSSIDTRTEILVQNAFTSMMEGRTCFIVAHRLSTIQNADRILVMKKGKIIEQGTHTELLKQGGFYSELYHSQFARVLNQ